MYQTDEETDATYKLGQKLAKFHDECILPVEVLNNTAQQNEAVNNIESMRDLSNCNTNNLNQNVHVNKSEPQNGYQVSIQSMTPMDDIVNANTENLLNENLESIELRDLLKTWDMEYLAAHLIGEYSNQQSKLCITGFIILLFQESMYLYLF